MRKSENFDLNLYEGTDIFNPLTTDVPNYEKIDAQMEKNHNLSVGKATELKTGTVHAITRENADCPMIHFTATSNFTSNDTFTVDGVQVSALLVDGSTLPTNCYIIGSEVICYLKGTLLTFFLSGSISKDSEKLGGELPDYYAKQVNVEQLETTVNSMDGIVEKNSNDIIKINNSLKNVNSFRVTSGYSIRESNCRRYLKLCSLALRIRKDDGFSSAFTDIANIIGEENFPPMPISSVCSIVSTDSGRNLGSGEVQINTDGKIKVRASDNTVNIAYSEASIYCMWILI